MKRSEPDVLGTWTHVDPSHVKELRTKQTVGACNVTKGQHKKVAHIAAPGALPGSGNPIVAFHVMVKTLTLGFSSL